MPIVALVVTLVANVAVFESRDRAATTEGIVTLVADPDIAYRVATDYANWSRMFPGVQRAVVGKRTRDSIEVSFVRRDGGVDHLRFHNRPAARVVAFEQVGGDADVSAEIAFGPGTVAGTTRVHARLHADVHGFASAFVSESDLRALRQQHVRADLGQLAAFFRTRR